MYFPLIGALKEVHAHDTIYGYFFLLLCLGSIWASVGVIIWVGVKKHIILLIIFLAVPLIGFGCYCSRKFFRKSYRLELLFEIITSPIVFIVVICYFFYKQSTELVSQIVIIRRPRYRLKSQDASTISLPLCPDCNILLDKSHLEPEDASLRRLPLCSDCNILLDKSRLITGSTHYISTAFERLAHLSIDGLNESATNCHLCSLLLLSVISRSVHNVNQGPLMHPDPEALKPSSKLRLRLWEERSKSQPEGLLKMKLEGDAIKDANTLIIKEIPVGKYNSTSWRELLLSGISTMSSQKAVSNVPCRLRFYVGCRYTVDKPVS